MTVIAVKIDDKSISIASDGQTTAGYNTWKNSKGEIYKDATKILDINDMVIGVSGLVKNNCLLSIFCKNHKPKEATEDSLLDFLVEFHEWGKKKDSEMKLNDNAFIFIYDNKVFEVVDGYLVREVKRYTAIGSGMFLALGALYFDRTVAEAVAVAKEHDAFCGGGTHMKVIIKNN